MEGVLAIGVGLGLRIVVDVATDNDDRVGGVLVGLWEGVVLNHFVRRMPRSFDPYLGFGFRIFVDFLFTQSLSRLALVVLWALVGMLLADVAPNVWRDSGLRHLYRQVCKDVRHVKRSVPHIRIKNDLPSVRLFNKSRSTSSSVSGSIRSDRATPSQSPAPSRAPTPGPARRPGPSPPGTFPDVSGWSDTGTDVSNPRERVVIPGPSPALIPSREHSREHATYERIGSTHIATPRPRSTTAQDAAITITQTQEESVSLETVASTSLEPIDDPSRHNPPAIPDDWVDVDHPISTRSNEPVAPFQPDPESTPEPQPGPSTFSQSRPASILGPPPAIDVLPDIPDVDHGNRASRPPEKIPLPGSRAASVIGGVYDQPRSALRDSLPSRVGKATSEIGVDSAKSLAPPVDTQLTKSQSTSRSWSPWGRSRLKQSVDADAPKPPKETQEAPVGQLKPDVGGADQGSEPQISTPAQQDPPASILTQSRDAPPLLLTPEPHSEQQQEQPQASKLDRTPALPAPPASILTQPGDAPPPLLTSEPHSEQRQEQPQTSKLDPPASILTQSGDVLPLLLTSEPHSEQQQEQPQTSKLDQTPAGVDSSPAPPQGGADRGDTAGPRKASLFNLPSPSRTPPPPFTEFDGVPQGPAAGEGPAAKDPVTQDEAPTELTEEQKAAEKKRIAFLLTQVQELEGSRGDLRKKLDREDDPSGRPANAIESDLEDGEKTLSSIKARIAKKKFSEPPSNPSIPEVALANKSVADVQFAITSAVMDMLLTRDDAGPMTIQAAINRQKPLKGKAKDAKDAVMAFAKRHRFTARFETATPGIINITF